MSSNMKICMPKTLLLIMGAAFVDRQFAMISFMIVTIFDYLKMK